ncbi:MAG: hypothetical protein NW224_02375 [Leptolyngbyaceae cyanobacterium bins.302]|nr:hypothetical protein [Leptolyngbyaceae cyanobacterium bins.302]
MLDLNALFAFSHHYCVAICAVLVPFNLLFTLLALIFVGVSQPQSRIWQVAGLAISGSVLMVLHVLTWLLVGVIEIQTFVLFSLGVCCLSLSLWAIGHPQSLRRVIFGVVHWVQRSFQSMVQRVEAS